MQLASGDHHPLQIHRTGEYELHCFIGFKTFGVDKIQVPFFLRRVRGGITFMEVSRIQILLLRVVDDDPSHRQIVVMQTQRRN